MFIIRATDKLWYIHTVECYSAHKELISDKWTIMGESQKHAILKRQIQNLSIMTSFI